MPDTYPDLPQAIADFHVHPGYSIDAKGSIDDFCRAAFNAGLTEICFATHYDAEPSRLEQDGFMVIDGNREKLSDETVRVYLDDVNRAFEEYGSIGLMVRGGLEIGYYPGCEKHIAELEAKFPLYYRLGAVHTIEGQCICCRDKASATFAKYTLDEFADRYFDLLTRCASSGLFDAMAHMDFYRRYGREYYGDDILTIHRGRIEKLFEVMIRHDVGFEINTSAIRHGQQEYYPSMEIVNMAREAGVQLIALGSDAHKTEQIALDFAAASTIAYELFPYVDE